MVTKKTSLRQCIGGLSSKNTDYKYPEHAVNQAESLKSLSSDLYTDNIRFIYELIQNADDAEAKDVTLTILKQKYLIIAHNGKAFDEKDVQGLCSINNGTKKKDLNKTGYKGLGFKAVFGKSDKVIIYSKGDYFRFDSSYRPEWSKHWGTDQQTWEIANDRQFVYPWQINPIWTDEHEIENVIKNFIRSNENQIQVANIILLKNVTEIRLAIEQLKEQPHMFLFLRTISQMTFSDGTSDVVTIDRSLTDDLKKVYFNQSIVSQWIIKRFELHVPEEYRRKLNEDLKVPEKLRDVEKIDMFFAAKYKDSRTNEHGFTINTDAIERLQDKESHLFSYLPTKISGYGFPILINTHFLTNANREQIHTDSFWNQWLFDEIGSKIFQWIKELVSNKRFCLQAYRLIPTKLNIKNNALSERFDAAFDKAIEDCAFILNREEDQLLKVDEVTMDLTTMSQESSFIDLASMHRYVLRRYRNSASHVATHLFIDYDENLSRIGVRQFNWRKCIEMFQSDHFLSTHSMEQNKLMIRYFYSKFAKVETTAEIGVKIEEIPFVMDQNKRLQLIKDISFPSGTLGKGETDGSFVNGEIFRWLNKNTQQDIKQWLQNLGIKERTDLTYLDKTIIPNASTYVTSKNAIETIVWLFKLFQKNIIGKEKLDQLKQLKLLTTRQTLIAADKCFFSDQFKPRLALEEYLKTKEDRFLSFVYVTSSDCQNTSEDLAEWRRFFSMLGVHDDLHIIEYPHKLTLTEAASYGLSRNYLTEQFPQYPGIVAFSGIKTIAFLKHTEDAWEFSKRFWSYAIENIKLDNLQQKTKIYWGRPGMSGAINGTPVECPSYIEWFVQNTQCIPTTLNTCKISSSILSDTKQMKELGDQYVAFPSVSIPQGNVRWVRLFNFKPKLTLIDCLDLLERFHRDEKRSMDNLDRIQMVYSYILQDIDSYSKSEDETIKSWAHKLYLLSENNQWRLAKDLYVYVEGNGENSNLNDAFPCLKLDFKNKTHQNLHKFLTLFGIKSIEIKDLNLEHEGSSPAQSFREKLIEILPFLKIWLTKLGYQSTVISSIDRILQQDIHFIESDCLKLFHKKKFVQETNVYLNLVNQHLYVTRPWNGETTFIDLPKKLCELMNIPGLEDKLRFLLKAQKEEIVRHFKKYPMMIPTDKDVVRVQPVAKPETVQVTPVVIWLSTQPSESSSVKDRGTPTNACTDVIVNIRKPDQPSAISLADATPKDHNLCINYSHFFQALDRTPLSSEELTDEDLQPIQVIDMSEMITPDSTPLESSFDGMERNRRVDQDTGYVGEERVYKYLQKKNSSQPGVVIKWENQDGESDLPYDILLIKNGKKQYIEVKSTQVNDQHTFQLSMNQIEAILQFKKDYFIYRVYLNSNKLFVINDIRQRLKKDHLSCSMTINLPVK